MTKLSLPLLALALVAAPGCMSSASMNADMDDDMSAGVMVGGAMMLPTQTLVENASAASTLTTLVSAVQAAELVDALSGPGPFTVFAPDNDAFAAVPESALNSLLMPENQGQLQGVLTYHVVPGLLTAASLSDGQTLTTLSGGELTVSIRNGMVMINGATVTQANVMASNGVAHVIDGVLMP